MRKELFADHRVTYVPDTSVNKVVMNIDTRYYRKPKTIRSMSTPLGYLRNQRKD
jgi:hypothetical protein